MNDDCRDLLVDLDDAYVDRLELLSTARPDALRRRVDHLLCGVVVQPDAVVSEASLREAGVERALHPHGISLEPPFEVVEHDAPDLGVVRAHRSPAICAAARAAPSVSTGR